MVLPCLVNKMLRRSKALMSRLPLDLSVVVVGGGDAVVVFAVVVVVGGDSDWW